MKISRRDFLKKSALGLGALLSYQISPWQRLAAHAMNSNKTLLCVFLRGGNDGLNTIVPYGDSNYPILRPKLGFKENEVLKIEGNSLFGFNPNLTGLKQLFDAGRLAVFPAAHNDSLTFSHFESQQMVNSALTQEATNGWLSDAISTLNLDITQERLPAISLGFETHELLFGNFSVTTIDSIDGFGRTDDPLFDDLKSIYNSTAAETKFYGQKTIDLGKSTFTSVELVQNLAAQGPYKAENGAQYAGNEFSRQLMNAANFIKNTDVRAMTLDIGGFDTHVGQRPIHNRLMTALDTGLTAFATDLGSKLDDVIVLTLTEFGRTLEENGSNGTDHGRATVWFALGGGIKSGIYGDWPGLAPSQLREERYLQHSIDIKDIIGEILTKHSGVSNLNAVFPGLSFNDIGFIS